MVHTRPRLFPGRSTSTSTSKSVHTLKFCEMECGAPMCRLPNDFARKKIFVTEKLYEKRFGKRQSFRILRKSESERDRERAAHTHIKAARNQRKNHRQKAIM